MQFILARRRKRILAGDGAVAQNGEHHAASLFAAQVGMVDALCRGHNGGRRVGFSELPDHRRRQDQHAAGGQQVDAVELQRRLRQPVARQARQRGGDSRHRGERVGRGPLQCRDQQLAVDPGTCHQQCFAAAHVAAEAPGPHLFAMHDPAGGLLQGAALGQGAELVRGAEGEQRLSAVGDLLGRELVE